MTGARTTHRRAIAVALAAGAATLLAACGTPAPQRDAAGAIAEAGEISLLKLREGDCVGDVRERLDNPDGAHNGVPRVRGVPCTEPHDGEVLEIAPIDRGEDWPGELIVAREITIGLPAVQQRLKRALSRSAAPTGEIALLRFKPTEQRWKFEDQHEIFYLAIFERPRRGPL